MALGGMSYGVTVREMTAAFCVFANGGYYYEPYTYTYVKDHDATSSWTTGITPASRLCPLKTPLL